MASPLQELMNSPYLRAKVMQDAPLRPKDADKKTRAQSISDLMSGTALATAFMPGVGDLAGMAADAAMYSAYPEQRNMLNYGLTALSALPLVPAVSAMRSAGNAVDAASNAVREGVQGVANAPRNTNWLHGTDADFQEFDLSFAGKNFNDASSKEGIFLSAQRGNAKMYGDNIMEVQDTFKNPKIINAGEDIKDDYLYLKGRGEVSGSFDDFVRDYLEGDPYGYYETGKLYDDIKSAKSAGHDALIVDFGSLKMDRGGQFAVAFDPSTIKRVPTQGAKNRN